MRCVGSLQCNEMEGLAWIWLLERGVVWVVKMWGNQRMGYRKEKGTEQVRLELLQDWWYFPGFFFSNAETLRRVRRLRFNLPLFPIGDAKRLTLMQGRMV